MSRLAGKRALVVGAGSVGPGWGNGKAAAALMARKGARVLCLDRLAAAAEETVSLIRAEGGTAEPFAADMTAPGAAEAASARIRKLWGGIDILHFNIGTSRRGGVLDESPEGWRAVFSVNLDAAFAATRAVIPAMQEAGGGAIVYVSSIAAIRAGPYAYASYEASKAALNRFARTVAVEFAASGIRANVVMPGLIDTPHVVAHIAAGSDAASLAAGRSALPPMKRQGTPWEVAEAALFLASEASSYVTGQCLAVDGGLSCIYTAAP